MTKQEQEDNYWIWTNSGKQFSYNYTDPDQICIEDIATALSKICRYAGHIDRFYSVADHCCNVVEFAEEHYFFSRDYDPRLSLGWLLHDAAEAYLSDIPAPAKKLLPDFKRLEKRIYRVIAEKYGAPYDKKFQELLDYYDKNIIRDEAELLFVKTPAWAEKYEKLGAHIYVSTDSKEACARYLEKFDELMEEIHSG